jgi:hypothetical protein
MASPSPEPVVIEVAGVADSSSKLSEDFKLQDTYEDQVEANVMQITRHRLHFTSLVSGRKTVFNPGRGYAFHRAVPLSDGQVFITGASGDDYMRHSCMLYNGKTVLYRQESEQGISTVNLVACGKHVYLIGGKWCEAYDLEAKKMNRVEAPLGPHLSGGVCAYNGNVLLVGGIQCQTVEMYVSAEQHWAEVMTLSENLYNIACIQVNKQEVLVFGAGTRHSWLLNVETCSLTPTGELPESVHDSNMIENVPVLHKGAVYCYVGEADPVLVIYDVLTGKWSTAGQARPGGCCAML